MVRVQQRRYKLKKEIDISFFSQIISQIQKQSGFKPILLDAQSSISKALGLNGKISSLQPEPSRYRNTDFLGEIFRPNPKIIIYIKALPIRGFERGYRVILTPGPFYEKGASKSFEVGEINSSKKTEVFDKFTSVFEKATKKVLKTKPTWRDINCFDRIKASSEIDRVLVPDKDKVTASKKITDTNTRNFLRTVKRGLLISDIQKKTQLDKAKIRQLNKELEKLKLISKHQVVVCKETRDILVKTRSRKQLNDLFKQDLSCGKCGRQFSEELTEEAIETTDLGASLIDKSYWFTIFVLDLLLSMNVPLSHIRIGVTDPTGETDILFCIGQILTIIELKDRDFNLNDLYKLNTRIDSFEAEAAIIITTKTVTNDAKKVLQELMKKYETPVLLIEGLGSLEEKIKMKIAADRKELVEKIILDFSSKIGISSARLIAHSFFE